MHGLSVVRKRRVVRKVNVLRVRVVVKLLRLLQVVAVLRVQESWPSVAWSREVVLNGQPKEKPRRLIRLLLPK